MAINPLGRPIDYTAMGGVQDPAQALAEGLKLGSVIRDIREKRAAAEQAEQAKAQYATDLQETFRNPTPEAFAKLSAKYPQQREAFKQSFDLMDADTRNSEFLAGTQAFFALNSGNVDAAKSLLDTRIEAARNAGRRTDNLEAMRSSLDAQPEFVKNQLGLILSSVDPKRWQETMVAAYTRQKEEAGSKEAMAKAEKAAVDAKFAESKAVADLNLTKEQIRNLQTDQEIARENLKINKIKVDLEKAKDDREKQELQIKFDEANLKRDETVNKKVADANTALANFDNFLNTADRALQGWERDKSGKVDVNKPKSFVYYATGPILSQLPTTQEDVADFEETIETLKSQAFLSQVEKMKGLGALTEREGAALTAALSNLSLRQSPPQLGRNLQEAQRLILKARNEAERKYGVKAAPDRPAGPGGAAPAAVPSAMGQTTDRAVAPAMPSGFRLLGRD